MDGVGWALLCAVVFAVACLLTDRIRRYALRKGMLDHANERSSHVHPTPRGGGLSIVLALLGATAYLSARSLLPGGLAAALLGGAVVAGIGWLDDRYSLSSGLRFAVHGLAAALALTALSGGPNLFPTLPEALGVGFSRTVAFVGLVWLVNLYNFMDGIDGFSGMEAVFVGATAGLLLAPATDSPVGGMALAAAAAAGGFLVWNWPPARIFMGDAGSGFLGYVFGVLALAGATESASGIWPWTLLLGIFLVDATVTLLRRMATGQRWREAHRSHAFQRASRRWGSHGKVTTAALALNLLWLLPCALLAKRFPALSAGIALAGLAPLVGLALALGAGKPED